MKRKPQKGQKVSWNYGQGTGSGVVTSVQSKRVELANGAVRNGTKDNPAVVIRQGNTRIVKRLSELK